MPFEYALLKAVPRIDRGECVNVGVVALLPGPRLPRHGVCTWTRSASSPSTRSADVDAVPRRARRRRGGLRRARPPAGPGGGPRRERFGWLTAPRRTVVQAGPVHSGLTRDPAADLHRLLDRLVR